MSDSTCLSSDAFLSGNACVKVACALKKLYCRFYMHTELQQNAVIRMADDALFWTTSRYTRVPTSHIYRSDK